MRQSYYYTRDHLGSVREMLNGSGSIVARYAYDPHGVTTLVSGSDLSTRGFAGMQKHPASGLDFTYGGDGISNGRPYNSITARFPTPDPLGETGGVNLYSYCLNDPVNAVDPEGLDITVINRLHVVYMITDPTSPTGVSYYQFSPDTDHMEDQGNLYPFWSPGIYTKTSQPPDWRYTPTILDPTTRTSPELDKKINDFLSKKAQEQGDAYNLVYNCWTVPAMMIIWAELSKDESQKCNDKANSAVKGGKS